MIYDRSYRYGLFPIETDWTRVMFGRRLRSPGRDDRVDGRGLG